MASEFVRARIGTAANWIVNREKARIAYESGKRPPFTDDPIINSVRFCNVRRMDDRVSKWMLEHWYPIVPPRSDSETKAVILGAFAARLFNLPEVLAEFGDSCYDLETKTIREVCKRRTKAKQKVFTGAYIINGALGDGGASHGGVGRPKYEMVIEQLDIARLAMERYGIAWLVESNSMARTHDALQQVRGIGSFMAGQIVADLRHVLPGGWYDSLTFAPRGPGSSRGMNWLLGYPDWQDRRAMPQNEFVDRLAAYVMEVNMDKRVAAIDLDRRLEAHDYQNTLCELSKYVRASEGGHVKRMFQPGKNGELRV